MPTLPSMTPSELLAQCHALIAVLATWLTQVLVGSCRSSSSSEHVVQCKKCRCDLAGWLQGFAYGWDVYMDQMQPVISKVPFMVVQGQAPCCADNRCWLWLAGSRTPSRSGCAWPWLICGMARVPADASTNPKA